jgi:TolB-like protein
VPLRRILAVFVLFACALLVAATPSPRPTPSAQPTPLAQPSATPAFGPTQPVVLIYPFEAPSDMDPRYGTAVAQIFAQVMSQTGGVTVLAIPSGIKREDYQKFAHVEHADYYISGYIQPIGQGAAIVAQVVDVTSEISVYSATAQVTDVQDIGSQALTARSVILQAAGVDRPELNAGPATSPTPENSNGSSVPISNVLSDLFKGKKNSPTPAPTPTPLKPPRGVLVVRLTGTAPADVLGIASDDLYRAMNAHYTTTMSSVTSTDPAKVADSVCGVHRNNTIASGVLNVTHVGGFRAHDTYSFTLNVYACFGALLYTDTETSDNYRTAIKSAVEKYNGDHPENNG